MTAVSNLILETSVRASRSSEDFAGDHGGVGRLRPSRVTFRLLRGPVPHVQETFELIDLDDRTQLRYDGELGTDFWAAGRAWGGVVASVWETAVQTSLDDIRARSEQRAAAHRRRGQRG